jgi:hypothetical protein
MTADLALHRALSAAREGHRRAKARRHRVRVAFMLADSEVHNTYADVLAAEAALREAGGRP